LHARRKDTVILEIAQPQLGHRPGPAGGEFQRGEDRPVTQAHQQRRFDFAPLAVIDHFGHLD
jgi:hypothetical protein